MKLLTLETSHSHHIGILRINRPEALNALNLAVLLELRSFLENTVRQEKLKAIILTGTGDKAFISGADIREMQKMNSTEISEFCRLGQHVADMLETAPYLTIAAINGYALGGGLEMALACDFIYANKNSKIGLPEVSLGLIPGFGGTQRLQSAVGIRMAKELIMSGKTISAEFGKEIGIINQLCEPEELISKSREIAEKVISHSFTAVMQAKRAINFGSQMKFESALELERNMFAACFETKERREAMTAFLEKSKGQNNA